MREERSDDALQIHRCAHSEIRHTTATRFARRWPSQTPSPSRLTSLNALLKPNPLSLATVGFGGRDSSWASNSGSVISCSESDEQGQVRAAVVTGDSNPAELRKEENQRKLNAVAAAVASVPPGRIGGAPAAPVSTIVAAKRRMEAKRKLKEKRMATHQSQQEPPEAEAQPTAPPPAPVATEPPETNQEYALIDTVPSQVRSP